MSKITHIVKNTPFVGVGLIILVIGLALADLAFAIGWFLHILEIQSVFDKLLPGWSAMNYFVAWVAAYFAVRWVLKAFPQ